jgi:hypothetical protein
MAEKLCMMPQTVPNSPINGALQPLHFPGHGHGDRAVDAFPDAGMADIGAGDTDGPPPLAHRGGKHGGHRVGGIAAFGVEQVIQAAARPEPVFEPIGVAVDPPQAGPFLEHHRPDPHAGAQQAYHDQLDDDVGLDEQAPER